ncbi:MAG TPA: ABC transporter permease subunit [Propylenella sp.]
MVVRDLPLLEGGPGPHARAKAGRSLWQDAFRRLRANWIALGGGVFLVLMAFACIAGPWLTGHRYDQVYQAYVKAPASLQPYPREAEIVPAAEDAMRRARVDVRSVDVEGSRLTIVVTDDEPVDERIVRYLERSDLFADAAVGESADGGRQLTLTADVARVRFLFGTDSNGRDLLTRTLFAGRISLAIGLLATFVALVIGVSYGAAAGYFGGTADLVMMRVVDILYSLPFIFFVILLVVFFGRNFVLMFIAVGAVEWLDMARIVRGQTIFLKRQEFVQAAEAMGVDSGGILRRHIVPNLAGPVIIYMTLMVPKVILLESFLSFLGLGVQEPMTSWGVLIAEGARNMQSTPTMLIFPCIFLVSALFALNFLGDGLRDALDPKDH